MVQIQSQVAQLRGVVNSMRGGRPENQDDWGFADTPLGFLLVVCDGMGGGPGGKTASYIAKLSLIHTLQTCNSEISRITAMKMAVSNANDALYRKMDEVPNLRGMGTTLVAILVTDQSIIVAHLGDSRVYRISGKYVKFRTVDHSLVSELVQNKALTEEQARVSPHSNVITRGLGNTNNHVADIVEIPYCKGDRFILCTDGIWGIMPREELECRFTSQQDLSSLVSSLSQEVDQIGFSKGGNHDNHTLAVIEMNSDSILKDKMSRMQKIVLGVISVMLLISLVFNIICLVKLGTAPQVKALENTIATLEKDNELLAVYKNMQNADVKEWITKIEILEYEKDLLIESQAVLISKVDSLERRLEELQTTSTKTSVPSSLTKRVTSQNSSISVQDIVRNILRLFHDMEESKGVTVVETVKKKIELRQQIIEQLLILDKRTNGKYSSIISGINRELQHPDPLTDKVMRNPENKVSEEYISTYRAKSKMLQLSEKIKKIQEKLK